MTHQLGILDLLTAFGFDSNCKAKHVHHQDARYDIPALIRDGWMELYQCYQSKHHFAKSDFIVTFTADGGSRSKLFGVYRVLNGRKRKPSDIPKDSPFLHLKKIEGYFYELKHDPRFEDLEGRVVIDWGSGTRMWHQHMTNKPVIEMRTTPLH